MPAKAIYELDAELRITQGKGASRRLRRLEEKVPAVLYGGNEPAQNIALNQKKVMHALEHTSFYSHILTLNMEGKKQQVILKDLQRHHYKKSILHMDFFRVRPTDTITMRVSLHFIGGEEAPGVEAGGIINHRLSDLEIKCQVKDLPASIDVDISKLEMDQTLHISDLKLPKGVESVALSHGEEHNHAVVAIHMPKIIVEEEIAPPAAEGAEGATSEAAAKETKESDKTKKG